MTVDGVTYVSVRESLDRVFVGRNGLLITPMKRTPNKGTRLPNGYYEVALRGYPAPVHRIIAELFIRELKDGEEVDHVDTNPGNNALENLRIVTSSGNSQNDITYGRGCKARQASVAKAAEVRKLRIIGVRLGHEGTIGPFDSERDAERETGISFKNISNSLKRKSITAGGYVWLIEREWNRLEKEDAR